MNGKRTTASSISQELVGTLQMAGYPRFFNVLRRCTNVILASARNSDLSVAGTDPGVIYYVVIKKTNIPPGNTINASTLYWSKFPLMKP
jgi:hypothetical protein